MTNKFEHLMTDKNREELKTNGKTQITQYSASWRRDMPVSTVSKFVKIRILYSVAKKILNDSTYCFKRQISKGNYDAESKTIELTGLYPIRNLKILETCDVEIIDEYYTYGA